MKGFTMAEVRRNLSDLVGRVAYGGERIMIQRRDKPLVALVSIEDAEFLERLEDEIDIREADKAMKEKGPNIPWEEAKKMLKMKRR
jgi:prevent-host-death family protein